MSDSDAIFSSEFPESDYSTWRERVLRELGGRDFDETLIGRSEAGLDVHPLYVAEPGEQDPGIPGFPPFVRGATAGSTAEGCQNTPRLQSFDPSEGNRELLEEIGGGADAVFIPLDRSFRSGHIETMCLDGAGVSGLDDLDTLLAGIDLRQIRIEFACGGNGRALLGTLLALADRRGLRLEDLDVGLGVDPLGALALDGSMPGKLELELADLAPVAAPFVGVNRSHSITVSTIPYRNAGADPALELGIALATGTEYLRALLAGGLEIDQVAPQIGTRVSLGRDLFLETAKIRALRGCWDRVLEVSGCLPERPGLSIHAVTGEQTLTRKDPWVNLLRATTQSLAAIVGGATRVTVLPYDQALGRPSALGRRLARNTQTILGQESHLGQVIDPAGGSHYLEQLTEELADLGWEQFQRIESQGGMTASLVTGRIEESIAASWARRVEGFATGREQVTGASIYTVEDETPLERPVESRMKAAEALAARVTTLLSVRGDLVLPESDDEEVPLETIAKLAAAGATVFELSSLLSRGEPTSIPHPLSRHREAESFEVDFGGRR